VLVAEDDLALLEMAALILAQDGCEVLTAFPYDLTP